VRDASEAKALPPGFRWPAEWERHEGTWLSWPHNPDTWPGCLAEAETEYVEIARALRGRERVRINVRDARMEEAVRSRLAAAGVADSGIDFFHHPTNDAWARDHGPIFAVRDAAGERRERLVLDFVYDAWGGKYPPFDLDDAIPARVAAALGLPRLEPGFVLEGGSIDGDGAGTLLTTETCLLKATRRKPGEAERTRDEMERRLAAWLGARQVVWLGGEVEGDDTDGHIDDLARFVAPGVVVACAEDDPHDPNHAALADNLRRLRGARDAAGKPLEVAPLPMPPPLHWRGERCPASYVNFYLANGAALVPVFGAAQDARALAVLGELLQGRELIPIPARHLVVGLGAVHCLTQQEPAPNPLAEEPPIR
jgi:agmatine deiminase